MKKLIAFLTLAGLPACTAAHLMREPASAATEIPQCTSTCATNEICMNTFTSAGAKCLPLPAEASVHLALPFDSKTEVVCTHSSGSGSHSGTNAFFALDLSTDYDQPAATVRASADGVAYVFGDESGAPCPEPPGKPSLAQSSTCGDSWGNRIKILHEGGYFTFYVHLDHALVKTGDRVRQGDPIGIEGWTGAAGHRQLHWSVQRLPGRNLKEWQKQILTYTGQSVPFHFSASQAEGPTRDFESAKISCAHANIGSAPASQQPRFRGPR